MDSVLSIKHPRTFGWRGAETGWIATDGYNRFDAGHFGSLNRGNAGLGCLSQNQAYENNHFTSASQYSDSSVWPDILAIV